MGKKIEYVYEFKRYSNVMQSFSQIIQIVKYTFSRKFKLWKQILENNSKAFVRRPNRCQNETKELTTILFGVEKKI